MTERGLPGMDSAPACPFVAFEDDRESRAASPDHRHRCYAEVVPSPRAAAHQEAYCLSSAFPVCPTFQDWARREAARTAVTGGASRSDGGPRKGERTTPDAPATRRAGEERETATEWGGAYARHEEPAAPEPVQRNPPRDWAAPPPWATGASAPSGSRRPGGDQERGGGETAAAVGGDGTPGFLAGRDAESRGLAGSAADRLAASLPGGAQAERTLAAPPDEELAGLVSPRYPEPARNVEAPRHAEPPRRVEPPRAAEAHRDREYLPPSRGRPTVSSTRHGNRDHERDAIVGPSWERARRFEAYPTLRARTGLSAPPRLALLAGALVVAAVGLFFLPALLGVGGGGEQQATAPPSASASSGVASPSVAPSEPAAPSQQVYVIKSGDTLSKVATEFGVTLEEILAANPTIENPDRIAIGDEIVIPPRAPEEFTDPSASPS